MGKPMVASTAAATRPDEGGAASRPVDQVRAGMPLFRFAMVVAVVGAAPLVRGNTTSTQIHFAVLVAFGWVPIAGVATVVARRRPGWLTDLIALLVDLGLLALVATQLHPRSGAVVAAALVLATVYTYVRGRMYGVLAGATGFLLASTTAPAGSEIGFTLALLPIACAALIAIAHAAAAERWRESSRAVRFHEKSDAILTGVAESVIVTTPRGRITQWNRAAAKTFGCAAADARGKSCRAVVGLRHDVRELDCSDGCALLACGAEGDDVEVWRVLPTGQRQPLLATALPVVDASGTLVEVVHSYRDITGLKQADEAKTMFLATASHELKTPLTVIRGFSQMLLLPDSGLDADQQAAALRAIDLRAAQLTGIVDRLLMSSRIESGRIDLSPARQDVLAPLSERVRALQSTTARDVQLTIDGGARSAWVDADAFTTIVDHLLDNAVKYSPNGGVITVALRIAPDDAERVQLVVSDEGVGMTPDQLQHCFEQFWQAEPTDVRRFGGTGIGLYIVRSLIEGMGGTIAAASQPGEGATFTVTLRAVPPVVAAIDPAEAADRAPVEEDVSPPPPEPSIIREYMRQLGVRVEAAP